MKLLGCVILSAIILSFPVTNYAQNTNRDTLLSQATLQDCINFALKHQPLLHQSQIDEEIAETTIKTRLSAWLPQVNANYSLLHYFQLPTSFIPDANGVKRPVQSGSKNGSVIQLGVNQAIFNNDLLLARQTAADVRTQAREQTTSNKINVVVEVSKAFYDLLLTEQQVKVLDENIVRQERSLRDAYNQYQGGLVDKIDYKREQIALNNTRADRKRAYDLVNAKFATLKQLMGYPVDNTFTVVYDSLQMEKDVFIDTLQQVQVNNRIEYQLLQTEQSLARANIKYYKLSNLPTVSAFGNYTPSFYNDKFFSLYNAAYPNSQIGLQLSVPIFQGFRRQYNIHNANLQLTRLQWSMEDLNNQVNAQYAQALASYKGYLAEYYALRENLGLAEEVYNTLRLQYTSGIKTYLDVIIAETDLRSAQLNYLTALNQALSSKLDMQRALGTIQF